MDDLHLKDSSPHDGADAVRCLICLSTFSGQPVASPQHCDHFYCLACITEWSKVGLFVVYSNYCALINSVFLHGFVGVNNYHVIPVDLCVHGQF